MLNKLVKEYNGVDENGYDEIVTVPEDHEARCACCLEIKDRIDMILLDKEFYCPNCAIDIAVDMVYRLQNEVSVLEKQKNMAVTALKSIKATADNARDPHAALGLISGKATITQLLI